MQHKAIAMFNLNHDPGFLPYLTWEERLARFGEFAGRMKIQVNLTGILSPGAEECALQHLQDLQRAWTNGI
jgi:hypothetical protein